MSDLEEHKQHQPSVDFSKLLPPEVWAKIFQSLNRVEEGVPLKLVSKYFKGIVENHLQLELIIDDKLFPGQSLHPCSFNHHGCKIGSIFISRYRQVHCVSLPPANFPIGTTLKTLRINGPTHPVILQQLFEQAPNLENLLIDGKAFSIFLSESSKYRFPKFVPNNLNIKNLVVQKTIKIDDRAQTTKRARKETLMCMRFVRAIKSSLCHPSVYFPTLKRLDLQYLDMPVFSTQETVCFTILPFIKLHFNTLENICLVFVPQVPDKCAVQYPFTVKSNYSLNISRSALQPIATMLRSLKLRLPQAILNGVLIDLFYDPLSIDLSRSSSSSSSSYPSSHSTSWITRNNGMKELFCEYEQPYQGTFQEQELAHQILLQVVLQNQNTLIEVSLLGLNWPQPWLTVTTPFQNNNPFNKRTKSHAALGGFKNLQNLEFGRRKQSRLVSCNYWTDEGEDKNDEKVDDDNFLRALFQADFPRLIKICIKDCTINSKHLIELVQLGRCPRLSQLIVKNNSGSKNVAKLDSALLSLFAQKCNMKKIVISSNTLRRSFNDLYWLQFKQCTSIFGYDYDANGDLIIKV